MSRFNILRPMFSTTAPPPQRLLVFARLPELGKVKTRLAATLGNERTLVVYETMLHELLASIGESTPETEIEILWAPTPSANGEALRHAFGDRTIAMQTGATLGDRLAMAFSERFFFHRTQKIVAIGVDDTMGHRNTELRLARASTSESTIMNSLSSSSRGSTTPVAQRRS